MTAAEAIAATQALPELEVDAAKILALPEYNWTFPRDYTTAENRSGFRWRRWVGRDHCPSGWVVGEYGPADVEGRNPIRWCRAVITGYACADFIPDGYFTGFGFREISLIGQGRRVYEAWCDRLPTDGSIVADHWYALLLSLLRLPVRPT